MTDTLALPKQRLAPPFEHLNYLDDVILNDYVALMRIDLQRATTSTQFARMEVYWDHIETVAELQNYNILEAINIHDSLLEHSVRPLRRTLGFVDACMSYKQPSKFQTNAERMYTEDHSYIIIRDQEYHASWLRRGGVGAFMMLARKWDRMAPMVQAHGGDIGEMLFVKPDRIDDVQDLRRYLMLVEAEHIRRSHVLRS